MSRIFIVFLLALAVLTTRAACAADTMPQVEESPLLQKCLKRADDFPDIAAAEATAWAKKGGGNDAHLCRAFAQANRGMYADSAREFWGLASYYDKRDLHRALLMHDQSGQEFLRAKDIKNAEAQYSAALKIFPTSVESLIGRAETRMATDRYWDALDDLNRAIKTDPANVEALRQRGRAWEQLGNDRQAQEDFDHAEDLSGTPAQPATP